MGGWRVRVVRHVHRMLLRAYPGAFRARYREELERVFEDGLREAVQRGGGWSGMRYVVGALFDALRSGLAERLAGPSPQLIVDGSKRRSRRMEAFRKDLGLALRGVRRAPAFTAIAVLTIALGIGANTAIFSVVRGVLLRPLPYEEPQELVLLWGELTRRDVRHFPSSPPDLQDFRERSTQLSQIAGVFTFPQPLSRDGESEQIVTAGVTPDFFDVLGIAPFAGRGFTEADGLPAVAGADGTTPAVNTMVMLSYAFWRDRFGADRGIIGQLLTIGGQSGEVVGVLPPGVQLHWPAVAAMARDVDVWFATRIDYATAPRNNVFLRLVARLAPGATVAGAQAEMDRISADLRAEYAIKEGSGFRVSVVPMHADLVRPVRGVVLALMGAVGFVLLVACANVANLLLVRAVGRERELAVRASLGATRGRLVRQFLAEGLLLGAAGAAGGVLLAAAGVRFVLAVAPDDLPRLDAVSIDGGVLAFTALATLAAVALFGVVPALRASRPRLMDVLREGGRNPSLGAGRVLRSAVVVAEVALCLVLLAGAGLMVRSFGALRDIDPGWDPDGLLTFEISLPFGTYPEPERRAAFHRQLQERLVGLPGVTAASGAVPLPFDNNLFNGRWGHEEALTDPDAFRQADFVFVQPGYFEAMGIGLVQGRYLNAADDADSAAVVVVDETFARRAFGDAPAVGQDVFVRVFSPEPVRVRIAGVVRDQRRTTLLAPEREAIYLTDRFAGGVGLVGWVVRTSGPDTRDVLAAVRRELRAIDPSVPLSRERMLATDLDRAMAPTRFALVLLSAFAGIALALAAVGLYGVLSFAVRQRTAEIGVRLAFGAPRARIVGLIVREGLLLGVAGVVVGLLAALALSRLIGSLLVGVAPTDPLTYASIAVLFLGVAALASGVPALRAAGLDPSRALREE